jgi:hypothetical protein
MGVMSITALQIPLYSILHICFFKRTRLLAVLLVLNDSAKPHGSHTVRVRTIHIYRVRLLDRAILIDRSQHKPRPHLKITVRTIATGMIGGVGIVHVVWP